MHPQTQAVIMAAVTAGLITVIGWYVTYFLSKRKEEDARRQEASLRHLQKQIEDMYGPLLGLIQQRSIVYEIAARRLPSRQDGIIDRSRFSPEDAEIYHYIVEIYFLPIDSQIATLLQTKIYFTRILYNTRELQTIPEIPHIFEVFVWTMEGQRI